MSKRWKSQGHIAEMTGSTVTRRLVRFWARLLAMLMQHWLLQASVWGDGRCSLHKASEAIREHATHIAATLGSQERLTAEIALIRGVLEKDRATR